MTTGTGTAKKVVGWFTQKRKDCTNMFIGEAIVIGFLSALGWWGANYYVITPYLPEPVYASKRVEEKKVEDK